MSKLFSVDNMTKEGLLKKFFIIFLLLNALAIIALQIIYSDTGEDRMTLVLGGLFFGVSYGFIPSVIVSFFWEFFGGKKQ